MNLPQFGTLYVVATPIGNLQDMTLRAIAVLKAVDWIAAEDTRHSAYLLQHFAITTPTLSLHQFNEQQRTEKLVGYLREGKSIALISDAGTPLISDPGYYLVHAVRQQGIAVVPVPGACAAIAALSAAGLPCDRFTFEGFLPAKKLQRDKQLQGLLQEVRTMIFYEAPHRILDSLASIKDVFGEARHIVMARELTKLHEAFYMGNIAEVLERVTQEADAQRGEIVLLVAGAVLMSEEEEKIMAAQRVLAILLEELPLSEAVKLAGKITGARKNELYQQALNKK